MKNLYTTIIALLLNANIIAQTNTWNKVSGIVDSTRTKGVGVVENQIVISGDVIGNGAPVASYVLSTDEGKTWSKLPTYQFAGNLPNSLPKNKLILFSNGFTFTKKLAGKTWDNFSGPNNFAEFENGSIIGSFGSAPDSIYNFSATGVKGKKLGNYTFKLSPNYCAGSNNRVFVFAYGVGLGYIDYSNLTKINIPDSLDGKFMNQNGWDMKFIRNMIKMANGNLFATGDGLMKSTNNGLTWTTVLKTSGSLIQSIAKTTTNEIYIIYDNNIKKSSDYGLTFTDVNGNLPSAGSKKELFVNTSNDLFCIVNSDIINPANSGIYKLSNPASLAKSKLINFNIYPNPSNGLLNINVEYTSKNSILNVTDMLGNLLLTKSIIEENTQLNMRNFSNGMYFITLKTGDRKTTKKISLQN